MLELILLPSCNSYCHWYCYCFLRVIHTADIATSAFLFHGIHTAKLAVLFILITSWNSYFWYCYCWFYCFPLVMYTAECWYCFHLTFTLLTMILILYTIQTSGGTTHISTCTSCTLSRVRCPPFMPSLWKGSLGRGLAILLEIHSTFWIFTPLQKWR